MSIPLMCGKCGAFYAYNVETRPACPDCGTKPEIPSLGLTVPARPVREHGLPTPQRRDAELDAGIDLYLDLTRIPVGSAPGSADYYDKLVRGTAVAYFEPEAPHKGIHITLHRDSIVWFRTGWALDFPRGHKASIKGRSGLARNHDITAWHVGTDDARFQGEVLVALWNAGATPHVLKHGDRIAQLDVGFTPSPVRVVVVEKFEPSPRGEKGFGSSGR